VREPVSVVTAALVRSIWRTKPAPSRTVRVLPRNTMPSGLEMTAAVPVPSALVAALVPSPASVCTAPATLPLRRYDGCVV